MTAGAVERDLFEEGHLSRDEEVRNRSRGVARSRREGQAGRGSGVRLEGLAGARRQGA